MQSPPHTGARQAPPNKGHRHWAAGLEFVRRQRWPEAVRAFERATRAAPQDRLYWINLANAERRAGAPQRALDVARRCLKRDPADALALRLAGDCLMQMYRYGEAAQALAELEAAGHAEPDAMLQHAWVLKALQRHEEAVQVLLRILSKNPANTLAHALLAEALRDLGRRHEAVECMKTVLALDPHNLEAMSHLSVEHRYLCDWRSLDEDMRRMQHALLGLRPDEARLTAPFGLISLPLPPELQLAGARAQALAQARGVQPLARPQPGAHAGRRPRIGWLSYDFRDHPVAQLLVEVLERMDRSRFEIVLYSVGPDDGSALRARLRATADGFVDLLDLADPQAAERIHADGLDLLVDLSGHTRGHRMGILARRPAPVQVAFLGYAGSTGAPYIDYLIGDPLVTPPELAAHYSEQLAVLPLTFQPNGRWRPLPQPMSRKDAGLPDDAFVMCAFNNTYKILPAAFDAWCTVMRAVPHAVLWLKETNPQLLDNIRREAAARGVDPARLVFAQAVPYDEHFSRLAQADVFVDTWPYNAHTTAADALWAGVPVVTHYGNAYASRVAASVLSAAGLGELAFDNVPDYIAAITALALEPALLAGYRQHLNTQRMQLPLFDTARYTLELEALLARMVQRWRSGLAPAALAAEPLPAAAL
jgi:predicted O-linked N-acetylglucosamine transferase (SPINDLY family)